MPITFGQVFSGYATQVENGTQHVRDALRFVLELALGGTAVGTGLNSYQGFDEEVASVVRRYLQCSVHQHCDLTRRRTHIHTLSQIAKETGIPFRTAPNKFEALAAHDALGRCRARWDGACVVCVQL